MKRKKLVEIFGDRVVCNLFSFVKDGSISKFNLKKMAEEMEVTQAYNAYKDRDPFDSMEAFDCILDQERNVSRSCLSFIEKTNE